MMVVRNVIERVEEIRREKYIDLVICVRVGMRFNFNFIERDKTTQSRSPFE